MSSNYMTAALGEPMLYHRRTIAWVAQHDEEINCGDDGSIVIPIEKETIVIQVPYARYRVRSLLLSSFAFSLGAIDFIGFLLNNEYLLHPSFDLTLVVGGLFLLLTTLLSIKGK